MDNSVEVEIKPVKADAELMSAWLGSMEEISISPKLLFDLQTLLRHYADFLVPNKDLSVDYKYEGTPCASVDKNQIFIPLEMLQEGRVDETIAAVIHELHHLKFSDNERATCAAILPYFQRILDTVEINFYGERISIWKALKSHGEIDTEDIIDRDLRHAYSNFIYQYFGDLFLLLNAIEDVRIDELQPENLKKYRFKQENIAFAKFEELYKKGELDKKSLFGSFIDALFHLKGKGHSNLIEESNVTKERILAVDKPQQYYPPVFNAFAKVLQDHAGSLWKEFETQESMDDSAITDFLVSDCADKEGDASSVEGDEDLGLNPKKASDCPELDGEIAQTVRNIFGESDIQDFLNAMEGNPEGKSSEPHNIILNPQQWAEIQAFKALRHIPCREVVEALPQGVNYDTLILDCYA
jgi:hypothetical protein